MSARRVLLCGTWPPEPGEVIHDGRGNRYVWNGTEAVPAPLPRPKDRSRLYRAVERVAGWIVGVDR